jgi:hypothetical protein
MNNLISAMLEQTEGIHLSHNPSLPDTIAKAMHWPLIKITILCDQQPVAWYAALYTGKEWFSLPHYNNGAFWYNPARITTWIIQNNIPASIPTHKIFYNQIILPHIPDRPTETSQNLTINITKENFPKILLLSHTPENSLKVTTCIKSRSFHSLSTYHLSHKVDSSISLHPGEEEQWKNFPPNLRRKISKARHNGITITIGGIELLIQFYQVYRENIHRLGSFALPKNFFTTLFKLYANGNISIFIASKGSNPIGGAIYMTYHNYAENTWFATLNKSNHLYTSYLLHWEMIKTAITQNCSTYSFGYSTKGSGTHNYKKQWKTTDQTIHLNSTHPIDDQRKNKQNLRKIIPYLPQQLTQLLDPIIAKHYY